MASDAAGWCVLIYSDIILLPVRDHISHNIDNITDRFSQGVSLDSNFKDEKSTCQGCFLGSDLDLCNKNTCVGVNSLMLIEILAI